MPDLRSIPDLDSLARDLERAAALPAEIARKLYVRVCALQAALSTALLPAADVSAGRNADRSGDRLLGPAEVAARIGKSRSWVEKHPDELPPRRRVGGEALWSERELEAWIRNRPRWDET
jgi:predicted DNA-binding transcriptional regulator AlpA